MKRALCLGLLFVSATAHAQTLPAVKERKTDDDRVHVSGYLGMEFATLYRNFESFESRGLSRYPYVLKVGDFHIRGLGPLDARINAAVTSLLAAGGFTKEPQQQKPDLGEAERYAAILGWALDKDIKLTAQATFARMSTFIAPNHQRGSNFPRTTYYVPANGGPARLHPGDIVASETTWYTLAVTAEIDGARAGKLGLNDAHLGYRLYRMTSPTVYGIGHGGTLADIDVLAVVDATTTCHTIAINSTYAKTPFPDLDIQAEIHGGVGVARVSNPLVQASHGICANYGGTLALRYTQTTFNLVVGYHFDELVAIVGDSDLKMSRTLAYSANDRDERVRYATAGERWDAIRTGVSVRVLAPFARLTVAF